MESRSVIRTGIRPRDTIKQKVNSNRPTQFRVLRQKGTERPGTGEYEKTKSYGVYDCAGCGTPIYKSTTKFDVSLGLIGVWTRLTLSFYQSGCGWPAFFDGEWENKQSELQLAETFWQQFRVL